MENQTFASWLDEKMRDLGLTQAEVADRIGCRQQNVSSYLRGTKFPGTTTIEPLADALQVTREEVLDRIAQTKRSRGGPSRPDTGNDELADLRHRVEALEAVIRQWVQGSN